MKKKTNNNKNLYIVIAVVVIIIILLTVIAVVVSKNNKNNSNTNNGLGVNTNSESEEPEMTEEEEIKTLSERARMKRYVGIFFENIENKDYQAAYNILNQEFKDTYFPTLDEFIEYANKTFNTSIMSVTYDNIERLGNNKTGNMYVLWVTIGSIYQPKLSDDEEIEATNFVILEKDVNNYEMSFSVNEE